MDTYKQAFVLTMETGAIALAVVMGEDKQHGEGLAHAETQEVLDGQVWDICAYPVTGDLPLGVTVLRP